MEAPYPEEVRASDTVEPRVEPKVEPNGWRKEGENDPKEESKPDTEVANFCISTCRISLVIRCHA